MKMSIGITRRRFARIRASYLIAAGLAVLVALWILSGQISGADVATGTIQSGDKEALTSVRAQEFEAQLYTRTVTLRGRTEAVRSVELSAQTDSTVVELPVDKGEAVEANDIVCQLSVGSRRAQLEEARALARQRQLEYDAAIKLAEKGYRAETQAAAAAAALDAAKAQVAQMETELGYTVIRAPFSGIVDERPVDIGDYLQKGSTCAVIVDTDPMLFVGFVSENQIDLIEDGQRASARLRDGTVYEGEVRFLATRANDATRTFQLEVEVPNPDGVLRAGLTAEIDLPAKAVSAHFISPAILVLGRQGEVGVHALNERDEVEFHPVNIIADTADGSWVTGLADKMRIITVGQNFVKPGDHVEATIVEDGAGI